MRSVRYSSPVDCGRRQGTDPTPEPGGIEDVDPGIRFVACQFVRRGIARLDDPLDRPEFAPDHASEGGRISGEDAGQGDRRVILTPSVDDRLEICPGHERDIARQHEDLGRIGGHHREGRVDGVTRPARFVLEREGGPVREDIDHRRDRRGEDHDRPPTSRPVGRARPGVQDEGQHRSAAQRMEDLGQFRLHPRAEPGRQYDGNQAA